MAINNNITIPGVGERLRSLREAKDVSQRDLALKVGIDKSTLSNYETGRTALSIEMLDKLANALGYLPEMVVLFCLEDRYPRLRRSKVGTMLREIIDTTAARRGRQSARG